MEPVCFSFLNQPLNRSFPLAINESLSHMILANDDLLIGGQFPQRHGPADVQALGGDSDFRVKT